MTLRQLASKSFIRGMSSLDGPLSFRSRARPDDRLRALMRVERKRQLA